MYVQILLVSFFPTWCIHVYVDCTITGAYLEGVEPAYAL